MALGAPTLFPIPNDGEQGAHLIESALTDVQRAVTGKEVRASQRESNPRRFTYAARFFDQDEAAQFRVAWMAATERLRFKVPLWTEWAEPTSFPAANQIAGDFAGRDFRQGAEALLFVNRWTTELVTIQTLTPTLITTSASVVGTYTPGSVKLLPVMVAWLVPPNLEIQSLKAEDVTVTFAEELQGVAGIDPAVGAATTPTPASLTLSNDYAGDGWAGRRYFGFTVHVFDAMGFEIFDPLITWDAPVGTGSNNDTNPLGANQFQYSVADNGKKLSVYFIGDADTQYRFTVHCGALAVDQYVNGNG